MMINEYFVATILSVTVLYLLVMGSAMKITGANRFISSIIFKVPFFVLAFLNSILLYPIISEFVH